MRNDLRIHDNLVLRQAADKVKEVSAKVPVEVVPVFCFDLEYYNGTEEYFYT
jgi:deoxyribodipyrimidine photolyase